MLAQPIAKISRDEHIPCHGRMESIRRVALLVPLVRMNVVYPRSSFGHSVERLDQLLKLRLVIVFCVDDVAVRPR